MHIKEIEIKGFRNLREVSLEIKTEGSFVIGGNGQGKTNFLEAIYYLGTMKSFRTNRDTDLINFERDFFRIKGSYKGKKEGTIEAAYDGKRKVVKIDGSKARKIRDAFGVMKVVVMTPDDVEMIRSYPQKRRRFLDIVISMTSQKYLMALTRYQTVLRHRNSLLKDGVSQEDSISAWDNQLSELSAHIAGMRSEFMTEYSRYYEELNSKLAGARESHVFYSTSPKQALKLIEEGKEEELMDLYEKTLRKTIEKDRALGTTTTGPHRDDMLIKLEGRDMKQFGSQGQQRTSVFALRIAEARYIEEKTGERPILLMDDVFSQLDIERGRRLMKLVGENYQTIITTPRSVGDSYVTLKMGKLFVDGGKLAYL